MDDIEYQNLFVQVKTPIELISILDKNLQLHVCSLEMQSHISEEGWRIRHYVMHKIRISSRYVKMVILVSKTIN